MSFEILGKIEAVETIAVGGNIRDIMRLRRQFGAARWRKLKGIANIRLQSGRICKAEIHWYEAHGIGTKKMKIKRILG
ncbi:MAG: hypothetical protein ACOC3W_05535 [Thermodesulfobacteriota bacterium]